MISLVPINPEGTRSLCGELGRHTDFRKTFPLMRHAAFQQRLCAVRQIQQGREVVGFILKTNPTITFWAYGERETLIMIYPEFQRQGIGTQVLDLIHEGRELTFFVSSKSNPASSAFFQKQRVMSLVDETERHRVYSLRHSGA